MPLVSFRGSIHTKSKQLPTLISNPKKTEPQTKTRTQQPRDAKKVRTNLWDSKQIIIPPEFNTIKLLTKSQYCSCLSCTWWTIEEHVWHITAFQTGSKSGQYLILMWNIIYLSRPIFLNLKKIIMITVYIIGDRYDFVNLYWEMGLLSFQYYR